MAEPNSIRHKIRKAFEKSGRPYEVHRLMVLEYLKPNTLHDELPKWWVPPKVEPTADASKVDPPTDTIAAENNTAYPPAKESESVSVKIPSFEAETKNDDIKKAKVSLVEESEKPKAEHLDETIASNINQSSDLSPDHFTPL